MSFLQQAFDKKYIFCNEYCIKKSYSKPFLVGFERDYIISKDNTSNTPKRTDNLKRCRDSVAQLVYTNLTPFTKFLTLTTSKAVLEVFEFQRMLQTFIQQMRRNGIDLKYIYVYERQLKRGKKEGNLGSLHVHMIIFNEEYIPMDLLKKCWKHGRVELKILNGLRCSNNKKTNELIRNPASYICKYITKESVAEWNEKVYRCSKNIERPIIINNEIYVDKNSVGVTDDSAILDSFFNETYDIFYDSVKKIRCDTESGHIEFLCGVEIGKRA